VATGAQHALGLGGDEQPVSNIILHVLAFRVLTVWLQARLARDEHQKLREKRQRDHTQRREASTPVEEKGGVSTSRPLPDSQS
jgi:hypothetical protein